MEDTKDDYKKTFIEIDFDNLLIKNNNPLANSYQYYVKHKESYIHESNQLYTFYNYYNKELSKLKEIQNIELSTFRKIFTYIDNNKFYSLKNKLKSIRLQQQSKLKNFLIYIDYLNANYQKILKEEYIQDYVPKRPSSLHSINSMESFKRAPSIKSIDSSKRRKNIFSKLVSRTSKNE